MTNRSIARRRLGRWVSTIACVAFIAPLTGCTMTIPGLVGFSAVSSLFSSWLFLMPLRSQVGSVLRDTFVGIF
jgi:hypothetical protein